MRGVNPHPGDWQPLLAVSDASGLADLLKRPIASVVEQELRHEIVGHDDVHPTVLVQVAEGHSQSLALRDLREGVDHLNASLPRYVREGSVAVVAVKIAVR